MRTLRFVLATALLFGLCGPAAAARADRTSYERAVERERALTAKAKRQTPTDAEVRSVSVAFENVARRFPTSGYADNALMKAAALAEQVYARSGRESDLKRSVQLYQWLVKEYPSSTLAKQARASARALETSRTSDEARETAATTAARPPAADAKKVAGGGTPAASGLPKLKTVRRSVLPEAVRLTLELDGEVPYQHERLDNPPRLFFDLKGAAPVTTLQDAILTYPDDVLRQVRLGSNSPNTTRVVLDLDGVSRYSVFTLYNPYRVVVDLERQPSTRRAASVQSVAPPPVMRPSVAPPPVSPAPAATGSTAVRSAPSKSPARQAVLTLTLAPAMPVTTRPLVPEPPAARVSRDAEVLRLSPETAIVSRDLEMPARPVSQEALTAVPPEVARSAKGAEVKPAVHKAPRPKTPATSTKKTNTAADELAAELARANGIGVAPPDSNATLAPGSPDGPAPIESSDMPLSASAAPVAPSTNANGGFSLSRQLGLGVSRIVIDPGHGGHDPGALNKGLSEAELVLDVALRLEKLLAKQPGVEVVLTRRGDVFIPLEERTAIANRQQADLFLSIHANASRNVKARGVETYFLNFASTPDAEAVAARENSASGRAMHNLPDIVKAIALNNKLDESRDLAHMVQDALVKRLAGQNKELRNLGVKQAPFVVLIGAVMPSVLAEISFLTNPQEAQLLKSNPYRQKIAEALFDAVMRYQRSLKAVSTVASQ